MEVILAIFTVMGGFNAFDYFYNKIPRVKQQIEVMKVAINAEKKLVDELMKSAKTNAGRSDIYSYFQFINTKLDGERTRLLISTTTEFAIVFLIGGLLMWFYQAFSASFGDSGLNLWYAFVATYLVLIATVYYSFIYSRRALKIILDWQVQVSGLFLDVASKHIDQK